MLNNLFTLESDDYEIQSDELLVIAIQTSDFSPYYKFAYHLNQKTGWDLVNIKEVYRPPENPSFFLNVLSHVDELNHVQYLLVENRTQKNIWIPSMPDVNFWVVVTGSGLNDLTVDVDKLLESFNQTEGVFSAWILPFENLKGKGRLLFDHFQALYDFLDLQDFIYRAE